MNDFANEKIRGMNGATIIRQDSTKYRSHNFFQVNPHVRLLSQLFQKSTYLSQFREMLFQSLQQIYLRSSKILTVLQWMQPPILSSSKLIRDQYYLRIISNAQQNQQLGIVSEQIYIIEIERFLKVIQNDNKEITLKILYELGVAMSCIIKGKQEFIFYDKFFAYLYHQFTHTTDYIQQSIQQREYLKKQKENKKLSKINTMGLRKIGLISEMKHGYLEEQLELLSLENRNQKSDIWDKQIEFTNLQSELFYDSVKSLIQFKGGDEALNYKFFGLRFNLKESLSINAIYLHELQDIKLYLKPFQLFFNENTKYQTQQKTIPFQSQIQEKDVHIDNIQELLRQTPPLSPEPSQIRQDTHQQTQQNDEFNIQFELAETDPQQFDGGLELDFTQFDPNTLVQFEVFSVNSECVAGIKISFPEEKKVFQLIKFPCIEPQEGNYDCHRFCFKPLQNLKGVQIELIQITQIDRFIKNFILLVQDSEKLNDQNKLSYYSFDFYKNQEMVDIENIHDLIIPYFNDDWRKVKFPLYATYKLQGLFGDELIFVQSQLKKINLVINSMFPNIEIIDNAKNLVSSSLFEIFVQGLGRYKNRDQYERCVFISIENWQQLKERNLVETLLDNIIIFIWSSGFSKYK